MTLLEIVDAWRSNSLPQDVETLVALKSQIDEAEHQAFNSWRDSTCKRESVKLVDDHVLYHDISTAIMQKMLHIQLSKPIEHFHSPSTRRPVLWKILQHVPK